MSIAQAHLIANPISPSRSYRDAGCGVVQAGAASEAGGARTVQEDVLGGVFAADGAHLLDRESDSRSGDHGELLGDTSVGVGEPEELQGGVGVMGG